MESLSDVVLKLSRDPEAFALFKNDQQAYLKRTDLSEADKEVLLSGDPTRIRKALQAEDPTRSASHFVIVVVTVSIAIKPPIEEES